MKQFLGLLLLVLSTFHSGAQDLSFTTKVDTNIINLGEQFKLSLQAEVKKGESFVWPFLPDTLEGLELVDNTEIDSSKKAGMLILKQQFTMTSFDSGYFVIPALQFSSSESTLSSDPIGIAVRFPEISEDQDYYDIKDVLSPGLDWNKIILISSIGLLLLAALIYVLIRIKRNKLDPNEAPKMILRPYAQAFEDLDQLEKEELWKKGEIKLYYSRLTDILRNYIQRELKISALESTAEELIESMTRVGLPSEHFRELQNLLRTSALVKFAKVKPTATENSNGLKVVRDFVEITKPQPEVKKEDHVE